MILESLEQVVPERSCHLWHDFDVRRSNQQVTTQLLRIWRQNRSDNCTRRVCRSPAVSPRAPFSLHPCSYDHYQPGQTANWWSVVHHNVWEADTLACIRLFLSKVRSQRLSQARFHGSWIPGSTARPQQHRASPLAPPLHLFHLSLQIRPNSVYIDFGAWVGPTALFASSYAKAVYAMEPDPGAYYELYWNVKMNPAIASKAQTAQLCISDSAGVLEMHGELGSSMSTLLEYPGAEDHRKNNNTNYADFKVECMSLQTFLDSRGINIADVGLIKMDTEGECSVTRDYAPEQPPSSSFLPSIWQSYRPQHRVLSLLPPSFSLPVPRRRRGEDPPPAEALAGHPQAQHPPLPARLPVQVQHGGARGHQVRDRAVRAPHLAGRPPRGQGEH